MAWRNIRGIGEEADEAGDGVRTRKKVGTEAETGGEGRETGRGKKMKERERERERRSPGEEE